MSYNVNEKTSAKYTATLTDEAGAVVPASGLVSLTLTLYDVRTSAIVNSRNNQNVLNANGVTVTEGGILTWTIAPADNTIVTDARPSERHRALFVATWAAGAKSAAFEVELVVANLGHLT